MILVRFRLCKLNASSVIVIRLLLLMPGIEPNPGPDVIDQHSYFKNILLNLQSMILDLTINITDRLTIIDSKLDNIKNKVDCDDVRDNCNDIRASWTVSEK